VDADDDMEESDPTSSMPASADDVADNRAQELNTLLNEKLFECVNKQKADEFCVSFCFLNAKNARRRLAQALIRLPRSRSELAPYYARIIASLNRIFPDILPVILDAQRKEFFGILKARKQLHVDSKLRNVRYQGEMIKFRLAPPIVAFRMFKALFADFTSSHNIEMLTLLMETCGRFLYLLPYTSSMMAQMLETMLRLRRVKNLDLHNQTLIESAYFAVKPPDRSTQRTKKEKPLTVVQKYIRYLLNTALQAPDAKVDGVIKSLRRLPWLDTHEDVAFHVVKTALRIAHTKYTAIMVLADCLAGLQRYYPNVVVAVVDNAWEEIQRSLETPFKRDVQRIHGFVRLLGELYNYSAISAPVVFELLYHLINYGHDLARGLTTVGGESTTTTATATVSGVSLPVGLTLPPSLFPPVYQLCASNPIFFDPRVVYDADSVLDLFRAQIVCELLNTTGMYFVADAAKDKLSRFLLYFQRYLLTKQMVPLHVEFTILDTLDTLEELARDVMHDRQQKSVKKRGPKDAVASLVQFPRYDSFESAQHEVELLETAEKAKLMLQVQQKAVVTLGQEQEQEEEEDSDENGEDESSDDESSDSDAEESDGSEDDEEEDDEEDDDDEDEDEDEDEDKLNDVLSESEAARMLDKLRIVEEDDEFERAFKNVMQVCR
jgi:regulator of nonsense transcripts 2